MKVYVVSALTLVLACGQRDEVDVDQSEAIGGNVDSSPRITFNQEALTVGIDRRNEPASAGTYTSTGTYPYGGWLADFNDDGKLDYYAVNHGQFPHLSGLFLNSGGGRFGQNLFTVAIQASQTAYPNMDLSNEIKFIGDVTGDGRPDLYFISWSGRGVLCVNQGVAAHADWTGPTYVCSGTSDGLAFADVNGDGKIDILGVDIANFDPYIAYYSQTAKYMWRLNNGTPDITSWPTTTDFLSLRVTDPSAVAAPFVDLNNDKIPDKIVGIVRASGDRGPNATAVGGQQVYLGRAGGSYALQTNTGLDAVTQPITRIEDINDDGCMDIGTDATGYRDNQNWYVQNRAGTTCSVTFTATARSALPYYTGFRRYLVDVDNSGVLSKVVIIHKAYGTNDNRPGGVSIYRKQLDGSYTVTTPTQSGININGTDAVENYANNLTPGDWNDDGRIDFAGVGNRSISGTDSGFALWTSTLATTNSWIKVTLPSVTGFFTGTATIEVFDAGFVGDPSHLVTPPKLLYTGKAWAKQVYHFGIGTRSSVDVRVTFPDGRKVTRAGVAPASRISIQLTAGAAPVAVATAAPTTAAVGQSITFSGTQSTDPDSAIVLYQWDLGDGSTMTGGTETHAYTKAGTYVVQLKVTDATGNTATASVTVTVTATGTTPSVAITNSVFTPTISADFTAVRVEWYFDGNLAATTTTAPFSYTLNLTPAAGAHQIVARAFNAAGGRSDSAPVTIQD